MALLVSAVVPSAAATGTRPSLKLLSDGPVLVGGRGFQPQERVTVRLYSLGGQSSKSVFANDRGGFRVRFGRVDASCGPLSATASGSRGSRASFKRRGIPPPCGVPIQP